MPIYSPKSSELQLKPNVKEQHLGFYILFSLLMQYFTLLQFMENIWAILQWQAL